MLVISSNFTILTIKTKYSEISDYDNNSKLIILKINKIGEKTDFRKTDIYLNSLCHIPLKSNVLAFFTMGK